MVTEQYRAGIVEKNNDDQKNRLESQAVFWGD